MSLLTTLQDEMKTAMKARDQARLNALRLMVSAIKYAIVDNPEMGDEQVIEVLKKEAKKRREAIEAYKSGGRVEQAEQEQYELTLIETYLPKMMSEEELGELVQGMMNDELRIMSYGQVMQVVMKELKGQAEGGIVAKIVKELLAK